MTDVGERILQAAGDAGLSINRLAKRLGVTHPTVSRYCHGQQGLSVAMLQKIADATQKPIDFFFRNGDIAHEPAEPAPTERVLTAGGGAPGINKTIRGLMAQYQEYGKLPIVGLASCGPGINNDQVMDEVEWVDLNEEFAHRGADLVIRVEGDSMASPAATHDLGIEEGDLVGIRKVSSWDQVVKNDVVLATIAKEATLKEYVGVQDGRVMLLPWNPIYEPLSVPIRKATLRGVYVGHIHLAARLIRRKRKVRRKK